MSLTTRATNSATAEYALPLAGAAQLTAAAALFALALLHVLNPELDPSWHMISEYALGRVGPAFPPPFVCWAASCWCAVVALLPMLKGAWAKVALVLLALSGAGALMGALFDIRHELHGAAFALGVPTLPIAALIISAKLSRRAPAARVPLLLSAHATWISLVLQAVTMALFISGLVRAGAFHPETKQLLTHLPPGVPAVVGYANRILVVAYMAWLLVVGGTVRRLSSPSTPAPDMD
jgi:Protein of unknown function (DUF998)